MKTLSIEGIFDRLSSRTKNSVGMAFSGGGAKGLSHIGVIMAMNKFGIRPNIISGVSAGSIASVLYAAGLSPLDIRQCFADSNKFADFREWTVPKDGIFKLNKFAKMLESWLPVSCLEDLDIPTVICATNLDRGTQVGWSKGEIVPRVVASCSIPIVFSPILINGAHYVDGGVLHNLPAWAIRDYCKTLIGCNCSPLDRSYKYSTSILDVALRTFNIGMKANVLQDLKLCDIVITTDNLQSLKVFDLKSYDKCIIVGYDAACRVLERLDKIKQ